MPSFRAVQPWGKDKARQATALSEEHASAVAAFDAVERLRAQMVKTGAHAEAIELVVVDGEGRILRSRDAR